MIILIKLNVPVIFLCSDPSEHIYAHPKDVGLDPVSLPISRTSVRGSGGGDKDDDDRESFMGYKFTQGCITLNCVRVAIWKWTPVNLISTSISTIIMSCHSRATTESIAPGETIHHPPGQRHKTTTALMGFPSGTTS